MKKIFQRIPVPIYLLLITILAYGIYIPWFGFYGDDWSYIWYQHLLGFGGAGDFASYDRPFSAMYYNVIIFLFGESVLPYQIYVLLLRWISGLLLWLVLKEIWKGQSQAVFWTSVLFIIFPGFGQQPIAVEYILHFAVLDLFLFSLWGMVLSLRCQKTGFIWLTLVSMICSSSVFALEYFIGLEVLRPMIIWKMLEENKMPWKTRLRKTVLNWLPYASVLLVFCIWRIFIFKFPTYGPGLIQDLINHPTSAIPGLFIRILSDFKTVLLDSWQTIMRRPTGSLFKIYLIILSTVVTISGLFHFLFLKNKDEHIEETENNVWKSWPVEAILWGLISILGAGIPFWVTGIPLENSFPWDRTSLPFMLGACLIMTAVLKLTIHPRFFTLITCCVVGLTLGWHLMNADVYHQEWEHMKSFYWQLAWRAPGLKTGTIIMSDKIPLYKVSDSGMTAPLNWTYAPDHHNRSLPYKVFDLDVRLDGNNIGLNKIEKGVVINHDYRSLLFSSLTDNSLVFLDKREACLHILSPKDADVGGLPNKVVRVLPLSNQNLIITDPKQSAQPPSIVFGQEPEKGWCYFYQKAELARQRKDWKSVMTLWQEAEKGSMVFLDLFELLPFIEGAANQKDFALAEKLSVQVSQNVDMRKRLCISWSEISKTPELSEDIEKIQIIQQKIDCNS